MGLKLVFRLKKYQGFLYVEKVDVFKLFKK